MDEYVVLRQLSSSLLIGLMGPIFYFLLITGENKNVFFYLCMEEHSLWNKTFGYNYSTNNDFERAMISAYAEKVGIDFLI